MSSELDNRLVMAQEIKKAQEEFAKQEELKQSEKYAKIAAEVQKECLASAKTGRTWIDLDYQLYLGDAELIYQRYYIVLNLPGICQMSGVYRYQFKVQIPED
jgi:hypothetical protein